MARTDLTLLPKFTAELQAVRDNGISPELLYKIIQKHQPNATYNKGLYKRYMATEDGLPIFKREPRYEEENPINNKVNNDFLGEIVDFKVGYFAGEPISYSYSSTEEAEEETGNDQALEAAKKALTDFVTRNNMFGVDMETTKNATLYGYSGRLFYIDKEGQERVMPIPGYETIILSDTDISEPEFAIRYYQTNDIENAPYWIVEFYDNSTITTFEGDLLSLRQTEKRPHLFDYCPLQGIANNYECMGDAEKVLAGIDDYDKVISDNSNEIEAFVHAYLIFEGLHIDDKTIEEGQRTGAFRFPAMGTQQGKAYWLTKNINDAFTEHHLQRLEDNIYRFSRTPNLKDAAFGTASGIALKFKLHGLETKCATFEANVMNAAQHMWKVLCSSWKRKGINADPLQFVMEFHRNFPLDKLSEAQAAQAQISAGLPKEWVFSQMAGIDDVDYIMGLIEKEKADVTSLYEDGEPQEEVGVNDKNMYKVTSILGQLKRGQITRSVATRILIGLGFTEEAAESLVDENDDQNEKKKPKEDLTQI